MDERQNSAPEKMLVRLLLVYYMGANPSIEII